MNRWRFGPKRRVRHLCATVPGVGLAVGATFVSVLDEAYQAALEEKDAIIGGMRSQIELMRETIGHLQADIAQGRVVVRELLETIAALRGERATKERIAAVAVQPDPVAAASPAVPPPCQGFGAPDPVPATPVEAEPAKPGTGSAGALRS